MSETVIAEGNAGSIPVWVLSKGSLDTLPDGLPGNIARWIKTSNFKAELAEISLVAGRDGAMEAVLFGVGKGDPGQSEIGAKARTAMSIGKLARKLPAGEYHLVSNVDDADLTALAWVLGGYVFDRYLSKDNRNPEIHPVLIAPKGCDIAHINCIGSAVKLTRDLINTPANDLGPIQLEEAFRALGAEHKATVSVIEGDALLAKNLPMVHAVGRASIDAPRLLDMRWGKKGDPKISLVGKGVSFDTGGLNIKPGASMAMMKKDMGGAANVLGLASMIMLANLPVQLRVLVPAVENAISGNAFRPGDILPSRKGLSVEIGNTDAEGRLILADALAMADEEAPEILIDMATLTGAARVALGPDLPPFYTNDDGFATEVFEAGMKINDPVWRLPLWPPYDNMLSSKIADVNHISTGSFAGSITAAMFLARFVENAALWAHFDIFAWVPVEKPWAPVGGEAQAIRALFEVLSNRYPA